jgi:hypothetical protein
MKIGDLVIRYSVVDKDSEFIRISFELELGKWVFTRKIIAFSFDFLLRISESIKTIKEEARHAH